MKFVQVQIRNNLGIMLFCVSQNSYFHDHNPSFRVRIIISSETSFIHYPVPSRGPQMEGARPQGGLGGCTVHIQQSNIRIDIIIVTIMALCYMQKVRDTDLIL